MAGLSSSDTSSLFFVFVFLGLASFPFSLASVVPFVSSFFFFGFYRFSLKIQNRLDLRLTAEGRGDSTEKWQTLDKIKNGETFFIKI